MGILNNILGNNNQKDGEYIKRELANLEEFGIDELENVKNSANLKEKLSNYEYYSDENE